MKSAVATALVSILLFATNANAGVNCESFLIKFKPSRTEFLWAIRVLRKEGRLDPLQEAGRARMSAMYATKLVNAKLPLVLQLRRPPLPYIILYWRENVLSQVDEIEADETAAHDLEARLRQYGFGPHSKRSLGYYQALRQSAGELNKQYKQSAAQGESLLLDTANRLQTLGPVTRAEYFLRMDHKSLDEPKLRYFAKTLVAMDLVINLAKQLLPIGNFKLHMILAKQQRLIGTYLRDLRSHRLLSNDDQSEARNMVRYQMHRYDGQNTKDSVKLSHLLDLYGTYKLEAAEGFTYLDSTI